MELIEGTPGPDELFSEGTEDELRGLEGNDTLDTTASEGNNTLSGGQGDDELFAGINDFLFGDEGNDTLDATAGRGGNQLDGGTGR